MLTGITCVVAFCPELVACLENGTSEVSAYNQTFLGTFAATISFVMSVLSVRAEQFRYWKTDFHKNLITEYFSKICRQNSSLIKI